jgi:hypothetical protein
MDRPTVSDRWRRNFIPLHKIRAKPGIIRLQPQYLSMKAMRIYNPRGALNRGSL